MIMIMIITNDYHVIFDSNKHIRYHLKMISIEDYNVCRKLSFY